MKQDNLSKWLKWIIIGVSICVCIVYGYIIPFWGRDMTDLYPELSSWYLPWLVFILITGIPVVFALIDCWRIASEIGNDNSFSRINAQLLQRISVLAAVDAGYFFAGSFLFILLNMSHLGVFFVSMMIVFAGVAIAIVAAALSHLVYKAAVMREENDLTI